MDDSRSAFERAAPLAAIPEGTCRDFALTGGRVLVCNVEGRFYAVADLCSHDGAPLGDARLDGCEVECPRHGATFDVRDGKATALPAVRAIASYPVRIVDGFIEVQLPEAKPPAKSPSPFKSPFRGPSL